MEQIKSRSKLILDLATMPPFGFGYPRLNPVFNEEALNLHKLFLTEEQLAEEIADEGRSFNIDKIYQIIAVASQIAARGYPTCLITSDEMSDIKQIYLQPENPHSALDSFIKLRSELKEKGNSAWTARVVCALAYLSKLEDLIGFRV